MSKTEPKVWLFKNNDGKWSATATQPRDVKYQVAELVLVISGWGRNSKPKLAWLKNPEVPRASIPVRGL